MTARIFIVSCVALAASSPVAAQSDAAPNWNGGYVGVNLGYGGGDSKYSYSGSANADGTNPVSGRLRQSSSGVLGGGQIGYNLETSRGLVFGLETDLAASDIGGRTNFANTGASGSTGSANLRSKIDYLGTVRARVGPAIFGGRLLPYVTGGFAYGGVKSSDQTCYGCSASNYTTNESTRTGWTLGAGAEYALDPHLSIKTEYIYTDLGSETISNNGTAYDVPGAALYNATVREKSTANIVRVGLNYRF